MSIELIDLYTREVMKFRKALNLTSISDPALFHARFVAPSVTLARWMPSSGRMLDIGSGMGIPGIPLLIACPGLTGVLVERRKKRAEFLRHVIRKLGLHAEVHDADINALPCLQVDVCVARAVADEALLLEMCNRHVNSDAVAVLPVPVAHPIVDVSGWSISHQELIDVDDAGEIVQNIRCYQFDGSQ